LRVNKNLATLIDFRYHQHFKAQSGGSGGNNRKQGKDGEDLYVPVPPGTVVYSQNGDVLADLVIDGQLFLAASGGRGGLGNAHFVSPTERAPKFAEKGEPGEEKWLRLELKVIADVGIVGYPNVGKSTLLAALTRAHPKIADYPFTTTFPNLGVIEKDEKQIVIADIPGLIEGPHQ